MARADLSWVSALPIGPRPCFLATSRQPFVRLTDVLGRAEYQIPKGGTVQAPDQRGRQETNEETTGCVSGKNPDASGRQTRECRRAPLRMLDLCAH